MTILKLLLIFAANLFTTILIPLGMTLTLFFICQYTDIDDPYFWTLDCIIAGIFYILSGAISYYLADRLTVNYNFLYLFCLINVFSTYLLYLSTNSFTAHFNEPDIYIYFPFMSLVPLYILGVYLQNKNPTLK
ncbi:hypothetical protein GCM10007938_09350 [Vibrio zhanjiangensis]|uniref:Uncharacterized protein n=1 Tax=Vibrio zhanjiangensis TaxID=1046128 RepID=A0ABQ6EVG1_9VIBR|nr:hypothetical protein GCM10007938_09350 [Vibrio zhanjiangensis]